MRVGAAILTATILATAGRLQAQSLSGVYSMPTSNGAITLTVEHHGTSLNGSLVGDEGTTFRFEAVIQEGGLEGHLSNMTGAVAAIQGAAYEGGLQFYVIPIDAQGQQNRSAAQQFVMERQSGSTGSPLAGLGGPATTRPTQQQGSSPLSGSYSGEISGVASTLSLERSGSSFEGVIDAGGYVYGLSGTADGANGQGTFVDSQAGTTAPFEITEHGGTVTVSLLIQDPTTGQSYRLPLEFSRRGGTSEGASGTVSAARSAGGASAESSASNVQRDPALVGSWAYSDTYISGDFSATTRLYMQVNPDGTYAYGSGNVSAGVDNSMGSVWGQSGDGDVTRGQWRTEGGIVYVMEAGMPQWVPYARYYVEGNSMMFTFGNGKRQLWSRR